jgi:16S rRNA (guanine527-N7)-methyltransferase
MNIFKENLISGLSQLGLDITASAADTLDKYRIFLTEKNRELNLTAIEGEAELAQRHFIDSLALLSCADFNGKKLIDIGTGAGFPGLPLKIAVPSIELSLLDSIGKKVDFLTELCSHLSVTASCIQGRAEELSLLSDMRELYDIAVSRALARLNVLSELCLPFVKVGGLFLAMKSKDYSEELSEAEKGLTLLGGSLEGVYDYSISGIARSVIIIRKVNETPNIYPRRFARIQKSPL